MPFPRSGGGSGAVTSVFTRTGAVTATTGDYTAAQVTNAADLSSASEQDFTGQLDAPSYTADGLTGATAANRWVGAITGGAGPVTGTFVIGDWLVSQFGKMWVCNLGGTPGTWINVAYTDFAATGDLLVGTGTSTAGILTVGNAGQYLGVAAGTPAWATITAAQVTNAADKASASNQIFTGAVTSPIVVSAGTTGASAASRWPGATTGGAPASGTFSTGDFIITQDGHIFVCTAGGSPGTWRDVAGTGFSPQIPVTASGTWTPGTSGNQYWAATIVGAGGGGGNGQTTVTLGGGGGGGGGEVLIHASLGQVTTNQTVTIGSGGGAATGGGTSSVGAILVAAGGGGGTTGSGANAPGGTGGDGSLAATGFVSNAAAQGAGSSGGTGDSAHAGQAGGPGYNRRGAGGGAGGGAASASGGAGGSSTGGTGGSGVAGAAGGGGAAGSVNGSNGATTVGGNGATAGANTGGGGGGGGSGTTGGTGGTGGTGYVIIWQVA